MSSIHIIFYLALAESCHTRPLSHLQGSIHWKTRLLTSYPIYFVFKESIFIAKYSFFVWIRLTGRINSHFLVPPSAVLIFPIVIRLNVRQLATIFPDYVEIIPIFVRIVWEHVSFIQGLGILCLLASCRAMPVCIDQILQKSRKHVTHKTRKRTRNVK